MGMPIVWQGSDCFTHMLAVGPTRCGKTATILKPMIYQLLLQKKRGIPLGISVVEPKGDVAAMVAEMCEEMDIPCTHVDPDKSDSVRFNPMEGDTDTVAEATVVVLKGLFGKQDAFFATVQELSARNVTKLLKELHGNNMDIVDVMNTLRDQNVLQQKVTELKHRDGMTDLVHFFESELLGSMREKYQQFVIGLRAQLEIESGSLGPKAMKQAILTSCRNKICFGGISAQDAQDFADEFGKDKVIMRQSTYKNRILLPRLFPDSYRDTEDEEYRFDPTDLMDGIPKFNFVHKLLEDGTPQKPTLVKGHFVPRDWKELREWEDKRTFKKAKSKKTKEVTKNSLLVRFRERMKKRNEKGTEPEQISDIPIESSIQPELETLQSLEITTAESPDDSLKVETESLGAKQTPIPIVGKESDNQKGVKHNSNQTKVQKVTTVVALSVEENIVQPNSNHKKKETSNVVKSNDGFWD